MKTQQQTNNTLSIIIIVLLIISIASSIWAGMQVFQLEELKSGWKENRIRLQEVMKSEIYKEQYSQSIDLMEQQINWTFDFDDFDFDDFDEMDDFDEAGIEFDESSQNIESNEDIDIEQVLPTQEDGSNLSEWDETIE